MIYVLSLIMLGKQMWVLDVKRNYYILIVELTQ